MMEYPGTHKFMEDSQMTFQEVFNFAYEGLIPVLRCLESELGIENFQKVLLQAVYETALKRAQDAACQLPCNDFKTFNAMGKEPSYFGSHVLTLSTVEESSVVVELKVTECLWAKTFRDLGAQDIGTLLICNRDFADCRGFNEKIRLERTKTLMQGDDCCNHRFVWEG